MADEGMEGVLLPSHNHKNASLIYVHKNVFIFSKRSFVEMDEA